MQSSDPLLPLPCSWSECQKRGWEHLDILLVTGDAYVDHPSFGIALIGRLLESKGYRVAILSQPRFDTAKDFSSYPSPKLFCGISAGNLDSIVANYSGNGKVRDTDAYSPNGNPWRDNEKTKASRRRPDRASIIYTSLARSSYKDTPIVLGGIEASLRRFAHFDFKQQKLRGSILTDAKADILVYGMGELAILEVADRLQHSLPLSNIDGTCIKQSTIGAIHEQEDRENPSPRPITHLPSLKEMQSNKELFMEAELMIDKHARSLSNTILVQQQQAQFVIQYPPPRPLSTRELDQIYTLPFTRKPHPSFQNVPAHTMIKDSLTIVRGCSGNCSFCSITRHQGPVTTSRSEESIILEAKLIGESTDFGGTITDLGGPTANLFATSCSQEKCKRHDCLYPKVCKNLLIDEKRFLRLLSQVEKIPGVNHVFISSGLRMELLRKTPTLLKKIVEEHTPGALKIAPEHTEREILSLMHKEDHQELQELIAECRKISKGSKKKIVLSPYIISSHPGCTLQHNENLVKKLKRLDLTVKAFQDFTPTPGSLSTAMYFSGVDQKKRPLHIPNESERKKQRAVIEDAFFKKSPSSGKTKKYQKKKKRHR